MVRRELIQRGIPGQNLIANGFGSVVTRLSMPAQQTLQLEHGLQLDF